MWCGQIRAECGFSTITGRTGTASSASTERRSATAPGRLGTLPYTGASAEAVKKGVTIAVIPVTAANRTSDDLSTDDVQETNIKPASSEAG